VKGTCAVAGVQPGGTVTREQVEAYGGPNLHINFGALLGTHLEPIADEPPAKKALK
jgi:hypothetical protein